MKVYDIIEAYGTNDEPAPGVSKAAVRKQTSDAINANKRANNSAEHQNAQANIQQQQGMRKEIRQQSKRATGIPNRAYMQQQAELQGRQQ
jgi:hypothetical protein